jgi:hypothetical protein
MVVKVSASDIPTPLVFNLQISGGVATGTILIPVGSDRKVELEAYDASHLMTHRGERTISVVSGTTALTIVLDPIVGTQQVNATLGAFTIAVTSGGSSSLSVGGPPLQLTATIMNNASPPQQVSPAGNDLQWASTTPAFFTVSNTGLVTAVRAGTGTVVATYKGFAGSFSITVQ